MSSSTAFNLVTTLRSARKALIFTGAGVSTGSGIPDFRGPQGIWKKRQPVYFQDFLRSEAARIEHWDYKLEGWDGFRNARPNGVHHAIVALEKAGRVLMVVTQNIDGLHALAGTSADRLVELHGTNLLVECVSCKNRNDPARHFEFFRSNRKPPLCECGGFLKPATISFGQSLEPTDSRAGGASGHAGRSGRCARFDAVGLSRGFFSADGRATRDPLRHHQSRSDGPRS